MITKVPKRQALTSPLCVQKSFNFLRDSEKKMQVGQITALGLIDGAQIVPSKMWRQDVVTITRGQIHLLALEGCFQSASNNLEKLSNFHNLFYGASKPKLMREIIMCD